MTFKKEKGRGHKCVSVGVFIENKEAWEKIYVSANTGGLYNGRLSSGYTRIYSSWQTSAFLGPIIIQTLHPPSYNSPKGDRQVLQPWICSIIIPCLSKVMIYDGKSLKRAIRWSICLGGSVHRIQEVQHLSCQIVVLFDWLYTICQVSSSQKILLVETYFQILGSLKKKESQIYSEY